MLILIEQVLKQYWYVSRCANNELAPCILKLKNNTEWKQTTITEINENRFGNFRFWRENMLDRFGFFSFSSPACDPCFDDGISRPAMSYCVKCEKCYCQTCFESHCQFRATKHHDIEQGSHMPVSHADILVKYCLSDKHDREAKDKYCCDHFILVYSVCYVQ